MKKVRIILTVLVCFMIWNLFIIQAGAKKEEKYLWVNDGVETYKGEYVYCMEGEFPSNKLIVKNKKGKIIQEISYGISFTIAGKDSFLCARQYNINGSPIVGGFPEVFEIIYINLKTKKIKNVYYSNDADNIELGFPEELTIGKDGKDYSIYKDWLLFYDAGTGAGFGPIEMVNIKTGKYKGLDYKHNYARKGNKIYYDDTDWWNNNGKKGNKGKLYSCDMDLSNKKLLGTFKLPSKGGFIYGITDVDSKYITYIGYYTNDMETRTFKCKYR